MTYPVAQEVSKKLVSGDSPLDFIKKNLEARTPQPEDQLPQQALAAEEAKRAEAEAPVEPEAPEAPAEPEPEVQTAPEPEAPVEPEAPQEPDNSVATNFKNVRKILTETKTQLSTKEQELQAARQELEKYKTGEILPEELQAKEAEIARLSKFEKIVSLKTSPEYQEKYIKPLSSIQEQLTAIANDYRIPPAKLIGAMNITNQAELNRFLSSHLDDGGFLEVKQLLKQAQGLQTQAKAAEKEPETALQQLLREGEEANNRRMSSQLEGIKTASRSTWNEAYDEIRKDGTALEVIENPDDPEHNAKFVEPIVKQAASEYGKTIRLLAENGLTKLPKELGVALAKVHLLSTASAVAMQTRSLLAKEVDERSQTQARARRLFRPPVGSSAPGVETTPRQSNQPVTPAQAGRGLINNVLANRGK